MNDERYKHLRFLSGTISKAKIGHADYLQTDVWKHVRLKALSRDCFKCVKCGSPQNVEVHHMSYPDIWGEEDVDNLVTLCHFHHAMAHGKEGYR